MALLYLFMWSVKPSLRVLNATETDIGIIPSGYRKSHLLWYAFTPTGANHPGRTTDNAQIGVYVRENRTGPLSNIARQVINAIGALAAFEGADGCRVTDQFQTGPAHR